MWQLTVRTAVPFVGFGFFDNTIMLTVGETLDLTLGVAFSFSTLAAAGMGQMVSDASGITLQGLIERFADRLGLPDPHLSVAQQQLSFIKSWMLASRIVGIVFGCFLGMFPLLMMPDRTPRLVDQIAAKLSGQQRALFQSLVQTLHFKRGDKLLRWGETSGRVYMIQSGQVEVIGRDVDGLPFMVCTIGPGHSFGLPDLYRPSHVDLVAKDAVVVQALAKEDFIQVVGEESKQVFESARSIEHLVYLRVQGTNVGARPQPIKGTGKTRFFASLTQEEKLEVLREVGLPEVSRFRGSRNEGKVSFFSKLSEEQKSSALQAWQERQLQSLRSNGQQQVRENMASA